MNGTQQSFTSREKFLQIKKEALWTGATLIALILFWLFAGFGVANLTDAKIFSLPLWAVMSSVGVWFAAIILVKCLVKFVFVDMDLSADDEGGTNLQ